MPEVQNGSRGEGEIVINAIGPLGIFEDRKGVRTIFIIASLIILLAGGVTWFIFIESHLPPAERGRRLAEANGCFNCHGDGGLRGAPNPGRTDGSVPTFEGDLMMYAANSEEIRGWIRDGVPESRAKSKSWQKQRDSGVLVMPAFGDRLSDGEIDDLVAFVEAVHGEERPSDPLALAGYRRGKELGCFGCHGPGGRFARPNPGSLKGYIPWWGGRDFSDLVHSREEFDQWVEKGISDRFDGNPLARFFLGRALLEMPAYEDHLDPGDLDALWAYVGWLGAESASDR